MEDLYEWKAALENALVQAPSAAHVMGQNGIFRNDQNDSVDLSLDQRMLLLLSSFTSIVYIKKEKVAFG